MTTHIVSLLTPRQAQAKRVALVDLLVDSVEGGASVNFVWPMTRAKAEAWWEGALASHARGERLIFAAEAEDRLDGTVQLILAPQENQAFRADLAKMLVHRRARRQGLGAALMRAAEDEARRIGRTLLTLDTETGSAGERLYARLGWTKYGEVPAYATSADNRSRDAVSFFYKTL
jgi:GNAT superfamily N-acetyltransferase